DVADEALLAAEHFGQRCLGDADLFPGGTQLPSEDGGFRAVKGLWHRSLHASATGTVYVILLYPIFRYSQIKRIAHEHRPAATRSAGTVPVHTGPALSAGSRRRSRRDDPRVDGAHAWRRCN